MNPTIIRRRFIAGAVCPACGEQDKIQMWEEDGVPYRECVAYDYAGTLNAQGQSIPKKLGIRVSQNTPKPANPKVQSMQFFPNLKLRKRPNA